MTEEDVKALHALNEDVAGAVRWLSGGAVPADMRLVNAAMLLTRVGLHIEKMIGDAEEAEFVKGLAASPAHSDWNGTTYTATNDGPTKKITEEERLIGTVIDDIRALPMLADIVPTDFDDRLMGALLSMLRLYAGLHRGSSPVPPGWLLMSLSEGNQSLADDLVRRGPDYLDRLAANRMPPRVFRAAAESFHRSVSCMHPSSRVVGTVA